MIKRAFLITFIQLAVLSVITAEDIVSEKINLQQNNSTTIISEGSDKSGKETEQKNTERFYDIKINLKILDDEKKELVNTDWKLSTLSGKPVSIHLKGNNLYIKADMTPYYADRKSILLLTQANVKLKPVDSEVSKFYSTVNSLPIKLGEKALFFPLGLLNEKMENISSCVLEIEVQPYDNIESINEPGSEQVGKTIKKE